jgi:alpha-mannosidase
MRVGYLPDMFGHVAQMPQILRLAGIDTAVVWRGVPSAVDFHRFAWVGIDGSAVVAEYLPSGYGNAAYVQDEETLEERYRAWFGDDDILGMVGTDHMPFTQHLPGGTRVGTLAEYLAGAGEKGDGLTEWRGEMLSAARANLLPSVVSARIDLKAACARAERWLERYAEPLVALYGDDWPEPFLREAWMRMFQNSAHDSICGCSADQVSAQVLIRYAEAEQIARELTRGALARIAAQVPRGAFAVVNPSPFERTDLVELDVVAPPAWETVELELPDGTRLPTQEVGRPEPLLWETRLGDEDAATMLARRLHGRELFGRFLNSVRVEDGVATVEVGDEPDPERLDVDGLVDELRAATAEGDWILRVVAAPKRTVVAAVPTPSLGWISLVPRRAVQGTVPWSLPEGTMLTRIVQGKDVGDSYNYAPPADDVLVDEPVTSTSETLEDGPIRGVDLLRRTYVWDGIEVEVRTRFERRAGEPFTRIRIDFDNQCEDQRIRVHVALRERATGSRAEGQFAVVERGLEVEGGYGEVADPTFPASAFVSAGRTTLLLDHVTEYEVVGDELALTVLRSIGLISRHDNRWREDPAGPSLPIPAAQMHGPHSFSFAIMDDDGPAAEMAERYRFPFVTVRGSGEETTELTSHAGPSLDADRRVLLTALQPDRARLVNESDVPQSAVFAGQTLELRPWEIQTVPRSSDPS